MTRNLDEKSIAVIEQDRRLLDTIAELAEKSDFTKADQETLDVLSAERDKLHATEAWQKKKGQAGEIPTMSQRVIYRDKSTDRLITQSEANSRDPFTYTEDEFSCPRSKGPDTLWIRNIPKVDHHDDD